MTGSGTERETATGIGIGTAIETGIETGTGTTGIAMTDEGTIATTAGTIADVHVLENVGTATDENLHHPVPLLLIRSLTLRPHHHP